VCNPGFLWDRTLRGFGWAHQRGVQRTWISSVFGANHHTLGALIAAGIVAGSVSSMGARARNELHVTLSTWQIGQPRWLSLSLSFAQLWCSIPYNMLSNY
jgi:hypothetical protein